MRGTKVRKPNEKLNTNYVDGRAFAYQTVSQEIKDASKKKSDMADELKDIALKHGQQMDDGSSVLRTSKYEVGRQARHSKTFDFEEAKPILERLDLYKRCVKTVTQEVIDEGAVEQAFLEGKIDKKDLEKMVQDNVTFAISVKQLGEE